LKIIFQGENCRGLMPTRLNRIFDYRNKQAFGEISHHTYLQ